MILAKVIANIWATRKSDELNGLKFMLVEEIKKNSDNFAGRQLIVADIIGAGIGDRVMISTGSSARQILGKSVPVDAIIIGIIDADCILD
ncbi:EutN/CcmL family microcompartment protein [Fusobacterium sp.]|uniref:EutN/CcmL family microcompartment protein n=1 Tax=Fusobacterium sp. TaxID=68766 RepID=UPI0025B9BA44|nr:EutN/CcmL family microcompartment protein [Fusobacterium sp.]